jgi:2,3-bisphosphoglycerate-independent phosphoglycerate mutase
VTARGPVVLVVLDGFGLGHGGPGDATALAHAPFFARLRATAPSASIETSGAAVGLPDGQMGNSEVGHMTLGAGRIIDMDIVRIAKAIDAGELAALPAIQAVLAQAERAGGKLHLMGLVSDGGVHSSLEHVYGILRLLAERGIQPILHAFTDGRDTAPRCALDYIAPLEARCRALGGCIATVIGRYWAMDRDQRWERVARAYQAIVSRQGRECASAVEAVARAWAADEGDEFIAPSLVEGGPALLDGDAVLFFNFRADRARELTNALTRVRPEKLGEEVLALPRVRPGAFATLTEYDETFGLPAIFGPVDVSESFGELVAASGARQLRIAETEKYAHVTYFFNGGREIPFANEDRLMIPSPRDVATYDLKPEMSARAVTTALLDALGRHDYAFVLVNYANPDMVGHTGLVPASVRAVEVVDECLSRLCAAVLARGGSLLVTADHGNVEQLIDPTSGGPHTAHTTNPVPLWWVTRDPSARGLRDGGLADLAPSLCELLGLPVPRQMTGKSLLIRAPAAPI